MKRKPGRTQADNDFAQLADLGLGQAIVLITEKNPFNNHNFCSIVIR